MFMTLIRLVAALNVRVLGGDLAKVGLDDGTVLAAVETAGVGGGTKVLSALCLHGGIDALRGLALLNEGLWLSKGSGRDEGADGEEGDE